MDIIVQLILYGVVITVIVILGLVFYFSVKKATSRRDAQIKTLKQRTKKRAKRLKALKIIKWNPVFAVDNGVIDADHKYLFQLTNDFNKQLPNFRSAQDLVRYLTPIAKYTKLHFDREIKLQRAVHFPGVEQHQDQHAELLKKYNWLLNRAQTTPDDAIVDLALDTSDFLRTWLIDHVIEYDLEMKPFVQAMQEHAKDMDAIAAQ